MDSNERQVGGYHYRLLKYQVWDVVTDCKLPFLVGSVIKYIARHGSRNSIDDLRKAVHYLNKCNAVMPDYSFDPESYKEEMMTFLKQFDGFHRSSMNYAFYGRFQFAIDEITDEIRRKVIDEM